ncbi:hypothetical protein ACF06X_32370 [Streptomyces sp. NPDC015346]|uniref:hypothetical protein n=1 Tax=Streptomyces sp. NPDC015346 TaxID=3364954 RepID=UPI0036FEA1B2
MAISQTVEWEAAFAEIMATGMGLLLLIGLPTLLIATLAAGMHTRMDGVRFRILLAAPLALCAWPLLAGSTAEPLVFQLMAQVAFAAMIPAPLFPANRPSEAGR